MLDFNFLKNYNLSENDVRTLSSQIDSRIKRHVENKKQIIMKPYLIQRAKFIKNDKKGIDSILRFDYMGSSEFEWGALPKSLERIRKNAVNFSYTDLKINGKEITVYSYLSIEKTTEILNELSHGKILLKEYSDFNTYIRPSNHDSKWTEKHGHDTDFWWDIENDFMFWKKNVNFEKDFKLAING